MQIVVTGGTGFLGRPLCARLAAAGHEVTVLTRAPDATRRSSATGVRLAGWHPDGTAGAWAAVVDGADALINLAGESIAERRWSPAQKAVIRESRVLATRSSVAAIRRAAAPPRVFVSGSAVGYYGDTGDRVITEAAPPGSDFLAQVSADWESEALAASGTGTRVAILRSGIVLERDGGALAKLLPPFRLFVGGPIGSGRQYMSWIHRDDWIAMVQWLLETDAASGPVNGTAPAPVTNAEFARSLGRALGRPGWLPAPAFALRLALGEMAEVMLINGQRVLPQRAMELGFKFAYPELDGALEAILRPSRL